MTIPISGEASTYSDYFVNRKTSNGDLYDHNKYTAALLPQSRWYDLPMGDYLKLSYNKRQVVVKVNDRGAGKIVGGVADESRVLDLSRAAYAYLLEKKIADVTDANAGVIQLDLIEKVNKNILLGPVAASDIKKK